MVTYPFLGLEFPSFQVYIAQKQPDMNSRDIQSNEGYQSKSLASSVFSISHPSHCIPGISALISEEKKVNDTKEKTPSPKLCLLQQRYSVREIEISNSIWMITEGMSQPHIATAGFVYVSHTTLSLSIIHFYLFYSTGIAKTESCYKNKVNALLKAKFSKTICTADSAILILKWIVRAQNNCQITNFKWKACSIFIQLLRASTEI